jgi:pyrrolidone-carboxylate peptidase
MDYILILCFLVIGIIIGYLLGTYTNFTGKNNSIRLGQAPNGLPITFKITTSNDYYSGTDSTVYILLYNNTKPGNMQKFILDTPKYNDFERGDSYDYKIQDKNIGMESLNMPIGLGIDGSDQWKVESVEIYYNNVFVKKYRPNIWLGGATKLIKLENNYNIITAKDLGVPGEAGGAQGGLPNTLQKLPSGKRVAHGTDPGNFYCEHMFFSIQNAGNEPGTSIIKNDFNEPLTGFLHLPGDQEATNTKNTSYTRLQSRKDTQAIFGSLLRSWIDIAVNKVPGIIKILLTGYDNWSTVVNNPTGNFVSMKENIDTSMFQAYGKRLINKNGQLIDSGKNFKTLSYTISTPSGKRVIQIRGQIFPVSDSTIDKGPFSVQEIIKQFKPVGVISMGVAVGSVDFLAEHHADNGGLDDNLRHNGDFLPRVNLPTNYSLARGIVQGQTLQKI